MVSVSRLLSTISKKIIKPSSPTPSTQRWHKLSLLDQSLTHNYMPLVFFYPKNQVATIPNGPKQLSNLLANSLSKTLTCYYPWAGSLKDNATIDCDDSGVEFFEVQISSQMDKVIHHPNSNIKKLTFRQGLPWDSFIDRALIVVQISHFDCGGIAISVRLSHKVAPSTIGNILTIFSTPIYNNERDVRLPKLVRDIRNSKNNLSSRNNLEENEWVKEMLDAYRTGKELFNQRNCDVYLCSSTLMYEYEKLDFGWGRPAKGSIGNVGQFSKNFILMNTPDRGVEALVNLNEQEMSLFENDKDLLEFATPIDRHNLN